MSSHKFAHVAAKLPQTHKPMQPVAKPKAPKVSKVTERHAYKLVLISEIGWFSQLNERNEKLLSLKSADFGKLSAIDKKRVTKIIMRAKLIEVLKTELAALEAMGV